MTEKLAITVKELIEHLKQYPEDMPVVYQCCSDWMLLQLEDIEVVKGVKKDSWIMRAYDEHISTMSKENQKGISEFLGFPGD